jgi:hypothetical protein
MRRLSSTKKVSKAACAAMQEAVPREMCVACRSH